ncbi:LOW QUALITY PROTEIN: FBD-associated F-box protein At5g44490-like [Brassica rapa]|uniref:LOW QUALITY PROTEIN: FBD-associated F-box protein At5g44490-like n=1 Tax=Brassica campestris TaxID=3711 RepID=UPI00142DE691|nr:LOW QUALITY PROTEIN: FBD-associated F-box protein At5g44490-like [Brassica rapa]
MDEKKMKGVCHERPAREDMISKLPDSLISQILFYLPTKEAVKTSVLFHRWEGLWLLISELDLDSSEFPEYNAFARFVDWFLQKSCLPKLKLKILKRKNVKSRVTRWIDFVARRKLIKHVDVEYIYVSRKRLEVMPASLYVCETLLYLRLNRILVGSFDSVSLPCLKTMRLEENIYDSDTGLKSLISSCPVLEDLSIVRRLDDNVSALSDNNQS